MEAPSLSATLWLPTPRQWFAGVRLPEPHVTRSDRAFSPTLAATALNRDTVKQFEAFKPASTAYLHLVCDLLAQLHLPSYGYCSSLGGNTWKGWRLKALKKNGRAICDPTYCFVSL